MPPSKDYLKLVCVCVRLSESEVECSNALWTGSMAVKLDRFEAGVVGRHDFEIAKAGV